MLVFTVVFDKLAKLPADGTPYPVMVFAGDASYGVTTRLADFDFAKQQLNLMLQKDGAFLPRPDSAVWANEREYLNVDGKSALLEFASARLETLKILKRLDENIWTRTARHAIFGPTNFLEAIGFMADHDRLHIQQFWKTIKSA